MQAQLRALPLVLSFACASACGGGAQAPATPAMPSQVYVGTTGSYPPFSEWKGDRPEGFVPAIVESFANKTRTSVQWTRFRFPDLLADMKSGRFDMAADGLTVRPDRSIAGRFTVPIARGAAVLLLKRPEWAKQSAEVSGPARARARLLDKPELRVVVNQGGHLERVTRALFRSAKIRPMPDNDGLRQALESGEADAAMSDTFEVMRWSAGLEGLERIGPIGSQTIAIWVRPNEDALAEKLDEFLIAEEESGRLGALRSSILGPGGGSDSALPLKAILSATIERLSLMPYVAAAKKKDGRPSSDPLADERQVAAGVDAVTKAASHRGVQPPARPRVDAFFRAEVDAAKYVEQNTPLPPDAPTYSYDDELGPAVARIDEKLALLVTSIPKDTTRRAVAAQVEEDLSETGLDQQAMDRLVDTMTALAGD